MQITFTSQEELDDYVKAAIVRHEAARREQRTAEELSVAELITGLTVRKAAQVLGLSPNVLYQIRHRNSTSTDRWKKLVHAASIEPPAQFEQNLRKLYRSRR